jgi:hypothetical protein
VALLLSPRGFSSASTTFPKGVSVISPTPPGAQAMVVSPVHSCSACTRLCGIVRLQGTPWHSEWLTVSCTLEGGRINQTPNSWRAAQPSSPTSSLLKSYLSGMKWMVLVSMSRCSLSHFQLL